MLSWHAAAPEEAEDVLDHGLPCVHGSALTKGGCGTSFITALMQNAEEHAEPSIGRVLAQTAEDLKSRCDGTLEMSTTYTVDMDVPFRIKADYEQAQPFARAKALLIGINYSAEGKGGLQGSHDAVLAMKDMLVNTQGMLDDAAHCCMLIDSAPEGSSAGEAKPPTRQNILDGLSWLACGAKSGDSLFLHFCGHTTRIKDPSPDNKWGMAEALVPVDYMENGLVEDDEVMIRLLAKLPPGVDLTIVMDGARGGSVIQLPYTLKVPPRLSDLGRVQRNDKYGKWIHRIETVCEAWESFSTSVLDAMGVKGARVSCCGHEPSDDATVFRGDRDASFTPWALKEEQDVRNDDVKHIREVTAVS
jgi:hypothetical protein